jgi:hypothetical protein
MKPFLVAAVTVAIGIAGCTTKTTKVEPATVIPAPAPAPTVVYQAPAPVIPAPAEPPVVAAPTPGKVVVDYKGQGGFELAQQKATAYCEQHGSGGARLVTNDGVGRATFDCL